MYNKKVKITHTYQDFKMTLDIPSIVRSLFPNGKSESGGKTWRTQSLSQDGPGNPSLVIWLGAGGFCDHSSGDQGDFFELVKLVHSYPDIKSAAESLGYKSSVKNRKLSGAERADLEKRRSEFREKEAAEEAARDAAVAADTEEKRAGAAKLVKLSNSHCTGVFITYFTNRGLFNRHGKNNEILGKVTNLKYNSAVNYAQGQKCPCIVGLVSDHEDNFLGVQRIYLDPKTGGKVKLPYTKDHTRPPSTRALGPIRGGAVRLFPLSGEVLAIGEGIESCLSFTKLHDIPCWAALSTSGLKNWVPPKGISSFIIAADNDHNPENLGSNPGMEAARCLTSKLHSMGFSAQIWAPQPIGNTKTDWNDILIQNVDPTPQTVLVNSNKPAITGKDPLPSLPMPLTANESEWKNYKKNLMPLLARFLQERDDIKNAVLVILDGEYLIKAPKIGALKIHRQTQGNWIMKAASESAGKQVTVFNFFNTHSDCIPILSRTRCRPDRATEVIVDGMLNTYVHKEFLPPNKDYERDIASYNRLVSIATGHNEAYSKWMRIWAKWNVVNPGKCLTFHPYIIGPKGCGKSKLGQIMCHLVGDTSDPLGREFFHPERGRFERYKISERVVCILDEFTLFPWTADTFKEITGGSEFTSERKYANHVIERRTANFYLAANMEKNPMQHIEPGERRLCLILHPLDSVEFANTDDFRECEHLCRDIITQNPTEQFLGNVRHYLANYDGDFNYLETMVRGQGNKENMLRYELNYNEEWLADLFRKENLQVCCLDDVIGKPDDNYVGMAKHHVSDRDQIVWEKHKERILKLNKSIPAIMLQLGYRRVRYDLKIDGERIHHLRWAHNSVPTLTGTEYYKIWLEQRTIKN